MLFGSFPASYIFKLLLVRSCEGFCDRDMVHTNQFLMSGAVTGICVSLFIGRAHLQPTLLVS